MKACVTRQVRDTVQAGGVVRDSFTDLDSAIAISTEVRLIGVWAAI